MKKKVEVVGAIIFNSKGEIFLAKRAYGFLKDTWEFPGGKVEPNETEEEAIVREIKEELDSTIKVRNFFQTVTYEYETFIITLHCYICDLVEGELNINKSIHEDKIFISPKDILTLDIAPADYSIAENLNKLY